MNTEQLLYGVAKYGFHDGSVGFIKACDQGQCIHLLEGIVHPKIKKFRH